MSSWSARRGWRAAKSALLAAILLAEAALARLWLAPEGKRRPLVAMLFWAGLGLGILVKGPIALFALALPIVALSFEQRRSAGSSGWSRCRA